MDDIKKMLQEANGFLRSAENNMFSGKNNEAVELLKKAEDIGRTTSLSNPDDPALKTIFSKIEKIKKDLERKGVKLSAGGNQTLPFEVQSHISRLRALLISVPQQPYLLDQAQKELNSYYSKFAGPMTDIPEIKEIKAHIEKLEQEAETRRSADEAEKAKKAVQTQDNEKYSDEWVQKFKTIPYFDGNVMNIPDLTAQKEFYYQAFEMLRDFDAKQFVGEKSLMLETTESDIRLRVKNFKENFNCSSKNLINEVKQMILGKIDFLKNDTAWQTDPKINPYYIGKRDIEEIHAQIDELKLLFEPPQSPEETNRLFSELVELNETRKKAKAGNVYMNPDLSDIDGIDEIKTKTREIVFGLYKNAEIRKINITKPWEFKHEEGWEDTSNTKWIHKEYNETVSQAAIKIGGLTCKLLTLHLEKPKIGESSFGSLIGHVMYEDEILEENII
jgi:hypothetical protein